MGATHPASVFNLTSWLSAVMMYGIISIPGIPRANSPSEESRPAQKCLPLKNMNRLQTMRQASAMCEVIPPSIAQEVVGRARNSAAEYIATFGENSCINFQIPIDVRVA